MKTEKEKREEEEEDLRPFRIHAYSKEELAMLYNPTYCISNAIIPWRHGYATTRR